MAKIISGKDVAENLGLIPSKIADLIQIHLSKK